MLFSEYCLYGRDVAQVLSTAHEVLGMTGFTEDQVGASNNGAMKEEEADPATLFGSALSCAQALTSANLIGKPLLAVVGSLEGPHNWADCHRHLLLQEHDILRCLFMHWKESPADSEETLCEARLVAYRSSGLSSQHHSSHLVPGIRWQCRQSRLQSWETCPRKLHLWPSTAQSAC